MLRHAPIYPNANGLTRMSFFYCSNATCIAMFAIIPTIEPGAASVPSTMEFNTYWVIQPAPRLVLLLTTNSIQLIAWSAFPHAWIVSSRAQTAQPAKQGSYSSLPIILAWLTARITSTSMRRLINASHATLFAKNALMTHLLASNASQMFTCCLIITLAGQHAQVLTSHWISSGNA